MKHLRQLLAAITFALLASGAAAENHGHTRIGNLTIMHPQIRATPESAPVSAGYLVILNNGPKDDRLVSASADFAGMTQLHRMEVVDGIARMRPQNGGIVIPSGEEIRLENGGLHIMFMRLKEPMLADETRNVVLTFEKAGEVELEMKVIAVGDNENHSNHEHDNHSHEHGDEKPANHTGQAEGEKKHEH